MKSRLRSFVTPKRLFYFALLALGIPALGIALLFLSVRFELITDLPDEMQLTSIENPNASELYAADDKLIAKYFIENRTDLAWEDLTDHYKNALIATEDVRFYQHSGVDMRSLARVAVKTLMLQRSSSGGGSTLTQQLAKNLYPRQEFAMFGTVINKFREMCIARDLEELYSKDQILLLYSNTVSFGELAFGLKTGALRFFNKQPTDLLLEEAATLVGMLKAPSFYSPRRFPERARDRRNVVLGQMAKYGYITPAALEELTELPLQVDYQPASNRDELAHYFKEQVRREFMEWSMTVNKPDGGKYNIYTDGLKIYTTMDLGLQREAEREMQGHMIRLQKIFEDSWKGGKMFGPDTRIIDGEIHKVDLYKRMKEEGAESSEILTEFTTKGKRQVWTWKHGLVDEEITMIDSIKHYLSLLHAGVLGVDPATGGVQVWVGGNDFRTFQWDNVIAPRQVGSTFKPIVYMAALEQGIRPCDYYENERRTYKEYRNWSPQNSDGEYGGHMTVQAALTHSVNTISVQVLFETGLPAVIEMARRLGITSPLEEVPSIVLGTSDVSLYEMVQAYQVFANGGIPHELYCIERIEDAQGNVLYEHQSVEQEPIIAPYLVDQLNSMLSNVTLEGSGSRLYQNYGIPFQVMGKTGTTQNQSDGLFIGYTDRLLIGAWVGAMDRRIHFRNLGTGSGGRTAMPMVGALYEYAATEGYYPEDDELGRPYKCPAFLPGREYALQQLAYVEQMIEHLEENWDADLAQARVDRKALSRKDKEAREEAAKEIARIKRERRDRLEAYKRQKKHWRKVLKELDD